MRRKAFPALFAVIFLLLAACGAAPRPVGGLPQLPVTGGSTTYLPLALNGYRAGAQAMHIPYFDTRDDVFKLHYGAMGIFWFGKVTPTDTYTDVRIGYNQDALYVNLAIVDRLLWYEAPTSASDLLKWDSASLYLNLPPGAGRPAETLRFDAELSWWEPRADFQAAFARSSQGWQQVSLPFTTITGWQGNAPGDMIDDRGWFVTYEIPFSSLSLSARPSSGDTWQLGITVNNRDAGAGGTVASTSWPDGFAADAVSTWNGVAFGIPAYIPPAAVNPRTVSVQQGNGVTVKDGAVGGWTTCGDGLDFWTQWGNQVYQTGQAAEQVNIQNQGNIADWPCFSRYYVSFPLGAVPPGKKILSAALVMYQFGGSDPSLAQGSLIQVLKTSPDWEESTLSWNHSPQAEDNYGGTWIDPLPSFPGWPGVARKWDVSEAVWEAYQAGSPALSLALYSADWDLHSGKYFSSSKTGDWNAQARPKLVITYGD